MSKRKYTIGRPIRTVCEFERCDNEFFIVKFGEVWRTRHRSFLESLQFHTLQTFCNSGRVYAAKRIEENN